MPRWVWLIAFAAASTMASLAFAQSRPAAAAEGAEEYERDVRPLLARFCFECHQGAEANAGLTLEQYQPAAAATTDRRIWAKVLTHVEAGIMPPPDAEQPSPAEREKIVGWIKSRAMSIDRDGPIWPGRVTVRRLNRAEYNNTIRDLLAVDFSPADEFPSDDVGYGFDNIGDVLSLPPVLFERYLEAADKIARKAIITDEAEFANKSEAEGGRLSSDGEASHTFDFPRRAEYVLRATASADQAGPEPAKMSLRLDDREIELFEVLADEERPGVYEARATIEAGAHRLAGAFVNDYYQPEDPDPNNRDRNLHVHSLAVIGPLGLSPEEYPQSHRRILTRLPAPGADRDKQLECAMALVRPLASRAFRRPASDDETARLGRLVGVALDEGETFEAAMQLAVKAMLVSPHFLYRFEADPPADAADGVRELNGYELATRLSYFLWSSMPDEELMQAASDGRLLEPDVLKQQALRMLKDVKSDALVENFAGQWLQLRTLPLVSPDPKRFRDFDDELRQAMRQETEQFVRAIIREDRSVLEFLDADYTFVNARLARHYGLPAIEGDEFQRVSIDKSQRGGLLGQASILMLSSNPTRTSPVKRGKWVLENLLGAPPPPPPPNVPELEEPRGRDRRRDRERASLRERLETHRSDPSCAACHQLMDPIGFGLENYDAIGAWRTEDGKTPIDASGIFPDGKSFQNLAELKAILLGRQDDFCRCLAEKLLTYAIGRGLEYYDARAVQEITEELARQENRFSALVLAIVASDAFRKRGDNEKLAAFLERSRPKGNNGN